MQRWVVVFRDSRKMLEIRANKTLRDRHVDYVKRHPELLIGGGLKTAPNEDFCGAMWIVEVETRNEVEKLVLADPFYLAEHRSFEIFIWGKILENKSVIL